VTRKGAPKGATAAAAQSNYGENTPSGRESQVSAREVAQRVHTVAVVGAALDDGRWDADVETLGALADLIQAAARWQLVLELEAAA
jgi:hypothetical protein